MNVQKVLAFMLPRVDAARAAGEEAGARKVLIGMTVLTFVLVVATIRKVFGRWQKESTETFVSEA